MKTYSTFEEFWKATKPSFSSVQSSSRYAALLAWNAACEHLRETGKTCTEWETAQEAKEMIV
jgi:hypothetical protein